jgi:phage terminase large subunit-like protein
MPKQQHEFLNSLTTEQLNKLRSDWQFWARDKQLMPAGEWSIWLIMAGRGFGKTRTGAETALDLVEQGYRAGGLIGRTVADVRSVMVEGPLSGLLACARRRGYELNYEPSKRMITWPNGAVAYTYSGDKPDQLRGPEHDWLWADELAAWRYPDSWDMARFGLRIGQRPIALATTTPRPVKHIRDLIDDPETVVTRGSTYENAANLSKLALSVLEAKYGGTRLGRQELLAELLDDVPGALWTRTILDRYRVREVPQMRRIVVAVDPAATSGEDSDETGIVVEGVSGHGHGYVLADLSLQGRPLKWAQVVVDAYRLWRADLIVAESNNGGEMVESNIHTVDKHVPVKLIHASRGKRTRAEPISSLYEQGRIHHHGVFAELEDQMCTWVPDLDDSPDHMDAAVWGLTELMLGFRQGGTT